MMTAVFWFIGVKTCWSICRIPSLIHELRTSKMKSVQKMTQDVAAGADCGHAFALSKNPVRSVFSGEPFF